MIVAHKFNRISFIATNLYTQRNLSIRLLFCYHGAAMSIVRSSSSIDLMRCSKCGSKISSHCSLFCSHPDCLKIQKIDPQKCNLYELFNLGPIRYDIDIQAVDNAYRNLQKLMHPDKFCNKNDSDDDRAISLENSAYINQGSYILKSPLERAFYILSIKGVEYGKDGHIIKNQIFMNDMFELREELEELDLTDISEVTKFRHRLEYTQNELKKSLSHSFNCNDLENASNIAIRLKYYSKTLEELYTKTDKE